MKKFTTTDLISAVRKEAKKRGENVYQQNSKTGQCNYQAGACKDGSEGCLFGQVLHQFDFFEERQQYIDELIRDVFPEADQGTTTQLAWCKEVQGRQDQGGNWRAAVKAADLEFPELAE